MFGTITRTQVHPSLTRDGQHLANGDDTQEDLKVWAMDDAYYVTINHLDDVNTPGSDEEGRMEGMALHSPAYSHEEAKMTRQNDNSSAHEDRWETKGPPCPNATLHLP